MREQRGKNQESRKPRKETVSVRYHWLFRYFRIFQLYLSGPTSIFFRWLKAGDFALQRTFGKV